MLGLMTILAAGIAQQPRVEVKQGPKGPDAVVLSIPVLVTDLAMHFVTGLDKTNFRVFEGKTEQAITRFSGADAPLTVGIVFDTSGSKWATNSGGRARRSRNF
jgi:hypothetical protein